MSSHSRHPPIPEAGLADNCDRCSEHAEFIVSLDDRNLADLWRQVLEDDDSARSDNERIAMDKIAEARLIMQRIGRACSGD